MEGVMTVEIELNERTLMHLKRIARSRRMTIEMVLKAIIEREVEEETASNAILGMFSEEPDLMDTVAATAMETRTRDPLRQPNG
jgi:hypothetical protein